MCNYFIDFNSVANDFEINIAEVYNAVDFSVDNFQDFIDDDLMTFTNNKIVVNTLGRLVIRNIAMKFDPLINQGVGTYSKTI